MAEVSSGQAQLCALEGAIYRFWHDEQAMLYDQKHSALRFPNTQALALVQGHALLEHEHLESFVRLP